VTKIEEVWSSFPGQLWACAGMTVKLDVRTAVFVVVWSPVRVSIAPGGAPTNAQCRVAIILGCRTLEWLLGGIELAAEIN
jgi:hypothetical protein